MNTDNYYFLVILVILIAVAAVLFVWLRRDRTRPDEPRADIEPAADAEPDFRVTPAEALIDPILAVPTETFGADALRPTPPSAPPPLVAPAAPAPRVAPVAPAPVEAIPVEAIPVQAGQPDTLTALKGLGPKAAARLNELGITRYDQLAALSGTALSHVDAQMGAFQGRILRDRWVEQAGHLAQGDIAGFEAKFGKLGG